MIIPTSFFSWSSSGELDSNLAELARLIPKLEDSIYHSYVQKSMSTNGYKDLALSGPEVINRLAKVLAILNHEVGHYPNMMPVTKPKHALDFESSLSQTKADCADIARLTGSTMNKRVLQQASLACITSAAKTAVLNNKSFLGLGDCKMPSFPVVKAPVESAFSDACILLPQLRLRQYSDFLN